MLTKFSLSPSCYADRTHHSKNRLLLESLSGLKHIRTTFSQPDPSYRQYAQGALPRREGALRKQRIDAIRYDSAPCSGPAHLDDAFTHELRAAQNQISCVPFRLF